MNSNQQRSSDTFGRQLATLRKKQGLSQKAVANAASISNAYYSAIEGDARLPPPRLTLMRLLTALRCSDSASDSLQKLSAVERGRSELDAYLPEEVQTLIVELRKHANTLPPRFVRALQTHVREAATY